MPVVGNTVIGRYDFLRVSKKQIRSVQRYRNGLSYANVETKAVMEEIPKITPDLIPNMTAIDARLLPTSPVDVSWIFVNSVEEMPHNHTHSPGSRSVSNTSSIEVINDTGDAHSSFDEVFFETSWVD